MLPKVKLKVGKPKFIAKRIFDLIKDLNVDDVKEINRFVFDFPNTLAFKIRETNNFNVVKNEIKKFVEMKTAKDIKEKTKKLQKIWNLKNDKYFNLLKKVLETKIKYKTYIGYTTNVMVGNYGEKNDFIVRIAENLDESVYIIAEEILHLVYWDIWRKTFKNIPRPWLLRKENKKGISVWKISEVIPEYVFNMKSSRKRSYNWIPAVKKALDPLWKKRKNFKDFLLKAHRNVPLT